MGRPKIDIGARREALILAATEVFADKGFRQTQMSDVAEEMGVSPGSLYNYVDSKETLFCWVLSHAFEIDIEGDGPLEPVSYILSVNDNLDDFSWTPFLDAALENSGPTDFDKEVVEVVGELFDFNRRFGVGIRLIEKSATDFPELRNVYFDHLRKRFIGKFESYIAKRHEQGHIAPTSDLEITSRSLLEVIAWWAIRQPGDPTSQHYSEDRLRNEVIRFAVRGLTGKA